MPDPLQGRVNFPGIHAPIGGTYSLAHGINPGVIVITCSNQRIDDYTGAIGTVTFDWKDTHFSFPQCRVFNHELEEDGSTKMLKIFLEDRRWMWRYPTISGQYNLRTADQIVYKTRRKNPQELARLLLKAMGEQRFDVSALPLKDYPQTEWYVTNAASALEDLANRYGCHTVLNLDQSIAIRKIGVGQPLPINLPIGTNSEAINAPVLPDSYEVHFGPTKYRVNVLLDEKGIDVDGKIKDAAKLSYAPSSEGVPWKNEYPGTFPLLLDKIGGEPKFGDRLFLMDLARKSVFKYFQITTTTITDIGTSNKLTIPGCKKEIVDIDQLLPIDDTLYNVQLDPNAPNLTSDRFNTVVNDADPADRLWDVTDLSVVWGTFFKQDGKFIGTARTTSANAFREPEGSNSYRPGGWQLDRERGILMFDDYVFKHTNEDDPTASTVEFPDLAFSFMSSVRDKDTGELDHYVVKRDSKIARKRGTKPQVILKPEYQLVVTHQLTDGKPGPPIKVNNKMLDKIANYYIDFVEQSYMLQRPQTIKYNGLWSINPDGAIMSVNIQVGNGQPCSITACYNNERHPWLNPYENKRMLERTAKGISDYGLTPPAFYFAPRNFPYNLGSIYSNANPSRR